MDKEICEAMHRSGARVKVPAVLGVRLCARLKGSSSSSEDSLVHAASQLLHVLSRSHLLMNDLRQTSFKS